TIEMQFLADVSLTCPTCRGRRFKDEVLEVQVEGKSVADVLTMSVDEALSFFAREAAVVRALGPLAKLGLGYLALGQPLSTLSGGEAQRIRLARALGEPWARGHMVIVDEPSAGLHPSEVARLNQALEGLARAGTSVVVVDHDLDVIAAADWVIDLGPGAGAQGGQVVAQGTPEDVARTETRTGVALRGWLAGRREEEEGEGRGRGRGRGKKGERRDGNGNGSGSGSGPTAIEVVHAREHNLREVSASIPHGKIVVVTGPSGS